MNVLETCGGEVLVQPKQQEIGNSEVVQPAGGGRCARIVFKVLPRTRQFPVCA